MSLTTLKGKQKVSKHIEKGMPRSMTTKLYKTTEWFAQCKMAKLHEHGN